MLRRRSAWSILLPLLVSSCGAGGGGGPASSRSDDRPNLLFILSDDQRPDAIGVEGNRNVRTPSLDRLAAEGARLEAFYVSTPMCAPSRAAFLTGRYGHQTGVLSNAALGPVHAARDLDLFGFPTADLDPGTKTIGHALHEAGYETGFVGKAHLGGDPRVWGFDETPVWLRQAAIPGTTGADPVLTVDGQPRRFSGHASAIFADAAIDFIHRHRDDRWFLWLAPTAPHFPYDVTDEYDVDPASIVPPPLWPPEEPLSGYDWRSYYATINLLDAQIGRVLDALREEGLIDETFIVFTSDNGEMMGRFGPDSRLSEKGVWYEASARTPAIVRYPARVTPGSLVQSPVGAVDVVSTLLELGRATPLPGTGEAKSVLPALAGEKPLRSAVFAEQSSPLPSEPYQWQMVREGPVKYVHFDDGKELLYDLDADPNEEAPLSGDDERLARMRALRTAWLEATPP